MGRIRYAWAMAAFALCGMVATAGRAEVTTTGDTYDDGSKFYAGYNANTTGTLTIDAGSVFNRSYGYLGYNPGSTGTATITGAGSTWTSSSLLRVGFYGSGTLRVEAGGQVSSNGGTLGYSSGSTGTAIISGVGSNWTNSGDLHVGSQSGGTLRVEAGGQVNNTIGYLGSYSGSAGEAIITGAGSKWSCGSLLVGDQGGSGTLTVSDQGQVSVKTLCASLSDLHGNGTITVQSDAFLDGDLIFDATGSAAQAAAFGTGGNLQLPTDGSGLLSVGYRHAGSLRIADGRSVTSSIGYLGYSSGSTGTAVITGTGSKWSCGSLLVGGQGSGTLTVEDGGKISSTSSYVSYSRGSLGKVTLTGAGSTWTTSGTLSVATGGLVEQSGGTVHAGSITIGSKGSYILSGGLLEVSTLMIFGAGGSVSWRAGELSAPSLTVIGGRLDISPGGDKLLKLSSLNFANAGTLDLADNAMIVQADATSGGAVLEFISGKIGAARNAEKIWQGAGITSSVAREEGSGLYGLGVILNVDAQGKAVYSVFEGEAVDANSVLVKYTLNGDADLNGVVDGSDYFFIDKGFLSKASGYHNGDFDYNGVIDGSDYFLIDKAYLATHAGGGAAGVNAVPEPGMGMVAGMIAAAGLVRRRRGQ